MKARPSETGHRPVSTIKIAIQGLGIAGRARERSISAIPGVELAGTISRRPGAGTLPLEQALLDPAIHAFAVSTENTHHAPAVRAALEANKHVLCDYPLAMSGSEARELFDLAQEKNRVLHVEHIGLLTEDHQALKKEAQHMGGLKQGDYLFQGGWNEKLADRQRSGPYPILALSRLLQLADLFGPFSIRKHELKEHGQGFFMHLHLEFTQGGVLGFTEERMAGLPRRRSFSAACQRGNLNWKAGSGGGGLFARDLAWFRDRVLHGKPCYYDEELMLGILDELERLMD